MHHYRAPGGESWHDLHERVREWYRELLGQAQPATVVVVSHGGVIRSLLTIMFHGDASFHPEYRHDNTGVSVVDFDQDHHPKLERLNDTSHL